MTEQKMTGKQMCEYIVEVCGRYGVTLTAEDIWNSSPSGEIWPVVELYNMARAIDPRVTKENEFVREKQARRAR